MAKTTTDNEVMCTPPSLKLLRDSIKQYKVAGQDNGTEKRKRRDVDLKKNEVEDEDEVKFKVTVKMGNRVQSPGFLEYKIESNAIFSNVIINLTVL